MTCGIYLCTNIINQHMYVGQSNNIERRWREHCSLLNIKTSALEKAIQKYGKENFKLEVVCELEDDRELLHAMEEYYVWKYNTFKNRKHYNLTPGGDNTPMSVPEIVQKCSGENHWMSKYPEKRAAFIERMSGINNPFYGKHHTNETKRKLSYIKKKLYQDPKNHPSYGKKRLDTSNRMSGQNHYNYGQYGSKSCNSKYTLWDSSCALYRRNALMRGLKNSNPIVKCFTLKYKGCVFEGVSFCEFISCHIINNIIQQEDI